MRGKRWCFTLNNPTEGEKSMLADLGESEHCDYLIVANEVGESGTPHLQGFVIFADRKRLAQVKALIGDRAHVESSRGTPKQASDYCKKDGDFNEYGELTVQGKRSDWDRLKEWCEAQETTPSEYTLTREFPGLMGRYRTGVLRFAALLCPQPQLVQGNPRDWQLALEQRLSDDPDDRSVEFLVDDDGGKGKSWFSAYWISKYPSETQIMSVGKRDDIAHAVDPTKRFFFFDVPRGGLEFFQYGVLEQLKNRIVFSPKYESSTKILHFRPHVVVFCNEHPDLTKLTEDRFRVTVI